MLNILFVCRANTCRSILAEGIFRDLISDTELEKKLGIDSAGTHVTEEYLPPDPRTIEVAGEHCIDVSRFHTRSIKPSDFLDFNYIVVMDKNNLADLNNFQLGPVGATTRLLLEFAKNTSDTEVFDPYDYDIATYRRAIKLIYAGINGLLEVIRQAECL
jgi:protein-tyrosine phosphatase